MQKGHWEQTDMLQQTEGVLLYPLPPHHYLPFSPCILSAGCPVGSALTSCARRLDSNPKPTWRNLNLFQTLYGKMLINVSWVDFSYGYLM